MLEHTPRTARRNGQMFFICMPSRDVLTRNCSRPRRKSVCEDQAALPENQSERRRHQICGRRPNLKLRHHRKPRELKTETDNDFSLCSGPQLQRIRAQVKSTRLLEEIVIGFLDKRTKTVLRGAIRSTDLSTSLEQIHLSSECLPRRHKTVKIHATRISVCVPSDPICS